MSAGQTQAAAERSAHVQREGTTLAPWATEAIRTGVARTAVAEDRDRKAALLAETGEALDAALAQVDAAQEMAEELRERAAELEASLGSGGWANAGVLLRVLPGAEARHLRDAAAELLRRAEGGR